MCGISLISSFPLLLYIHIFILISSFPSSHASSMGRSGQKNRMCGYTGDLMRETEKKEECAECSEVGVLYSSTVISVHRTNKLEECRIFCQKDTRCKYFSLDTRRGSCHLKSTTNTKLGAPDSYVSGTKYCTHEKESLIKDRMKLMRNYNKDQYNELDSQLLELDTGDIQRNSRTMNLELENKSYPVVIVEHGSENQDNYKTILAGIPANFGLVISHNKSFVGKAVVFEPADLCSQRLTDIRKMLDQLKKEKPESKLIGIVKRGLCLFSTKAENAVNVGFDGMVILDNVGDTSVAYIKGAQKEKFKNFPAIFLLKKEADILVDILNKNKGYLTLHMQDSSTVNWYDLKVTTPKPTPSSRQSTVGVGQKRPAYNSPFIYWSNNNTVQNVTRSEQTATTPPPAAASSTTLPKTNSTLTTIKNSNSSGLMSQEEEMSGFFQLSPLSLGSIICGLILALFLVFSVLTLIVGRIRKNAKRRENHIRCQQALSQLNTRKGGEENCGYDEPGSVDKLPKSVKYLFECPVCLDFAWPPRKIFQCQEGHIVCEVCYSNKDLQNCPICRIPIREQGQVSRNRQLEELSAALYALEPSSSTSGPPAVSGNAILAGHQLTGTQLRSGTPILDPNAPSAPPYSSITVAGVENSEAADQRSEDYIEEEGEDTDGSDESEEVAYYEDDEAYLESGPLTVILPPEYHH